MTANRYDPHLFVLPEDDANRQIANGFYSLFGKRQIRILTEARGWSGVCRTFEDDHVPYMRKFTKAFMVLVVDFDADPDRKAAMQRCIPDDLRDRVFVLGAWTEPEDLRRAGLGPFETIGEALGLDCPPAAQGIWSHALLTHNAGEIGRFQASGCSALLR